MLPSDYACPRCKCRACYALHRKGIDWLVSWAGFRPARCLTCARRFYARYRLTEDGKYILKSHSGSRRPGSVEASPEKESAPGKYNTAA